MPVVWSDACRLHEPDGEIFVGVRTPATEVGGRVDAIRAALDGALFVDATAHEDAAIEEVHDRPLLDYLAGAGAGWWSSGLEEDPGQDRVVPYVFPHGALAGTATPAATGARPGRFAYDTMTLIGPGTWDAARAA